MRLLQETYTSVLRRIFFGVSLWSTSVPEWWLVVIWVVVIDQVFELIKSSVSVDSLFLWIPVEVPAGSTYAVILLIGLCLSCTFWDSCGATDTFYIRGFITYWRFCLATELTVNPVHRRTCVHGRRSDTP